LQKKRRGHDVEPFVPERIVAAPAKVEYIYVNARKRALRRWTLFAALLLIIVSIFLLWQNNQPHIPDLNGAEDYSLATLTDTELLSSDIDSTWLTSVTGKTHENQFRTGTLISSRKFSGIYELFHTNYTVPTDFQMNVRGFNVREGNFKLYVINNGKIIAVIEPEIYRKCTLPAVTGDISVRIAAESADFTLLLDESFCQQYGINLWKDQFERVKTALLSTVNSVKSALAAYF